MTHDVERKLRALRAVCVKSYGSPLSGCCGAMSVMIARCFGGRIVAGRVNGARHYWNRLPCGTEVDLTSCQFGGDGFKPMAKGRVTKTPPLVEPLFLLFAMGALIELQKESP